MLEHFAYEASSCFCHQPKNDVAGNLAGLLAGRLVGRSGGQTHRRERTFLRESHQRHAEGDAVARGCRRVVLGQRSVGSTGRCSGGSPLAALASATAVACVSAVTSAALLPVSPMVPTWTVQLPYNSRVSISQRPCSNYATTHGEAALQIITH